MITINKSMTILFTATMTTLMLAGCTQVQDPWKSGDAYQQERMRSPETAEELDHRLRHTQVDR